MTVAQRITDTWPQTEVALISDGVTGYSSAKIRAIADATVLVYGDVTPLDPTPLLVEMQIADMAVLRLLPLARNYYLTQTRKSQAVTLDGGVTGSETAWDVLGALDDLETRLQAAIASRRGEVAALITPATEPKRLSFFTLAQVSR